MIGPNLAQEVERRRNWVRPRVEAFLRDMEPGIWPRTEGLGWFNNEWQNFSDDELLRAILDSLSLLTTAPVLEKTELAARLSELAMALSDNVNRRVEEIYERLQDPGFFDV